MNDNIERVVMYADPEEAGEAMTRDLCAASLGSVEPADVAALFAEWTAYWPATPVKPGAWRRFRSGALRWLLANQVERKPWSSRLLSEPTPAQATHAYASPPQRPWLAPSPHGWCVCGASRTFDPVAMRARCPVCPDPPA